MTSAHEYLISHRSEMTLDQMSKPENVSHNPSPNSPRLQFDLVSSQLNLMLLIGGGVLDLPFANQTPQPLDFSSM